MVNDVRKLSKYVNVNSKFVPYTFDEFGFTYK